MKDRALAERCRRLRLVLSDVDGVMTDGTVLLLPGGGEAKAFHIRDGLGIVLAQGAGIEVYDATSGKRLTDKPVTDLSYADQRIEWGAERCYAIGRLAEIERLPVESDPSEKTCVTLKDRFPPAAPTGVTAVAAEGSALVRRRRVHLPLKVRRSS